MLTIQGQTYADVLSNFARHESLTDAERAAVEKLADWVSDGESRDNVSYRPDIFLRSPQCLRKGHTAGKLEDGTQWFSVDGYAVYVHEYVAGASAMNVGIRTDPR